MWAPPRLVCSGGRTLVSELGTNGTWGTPVSCWDTALSRPSLDFPRSAGIPRSAAAVVPPSPAAFPCLLLEDLALPDDVQQRRLGPPRTGTLVGRWCFSAVCRCPGREAVSVDA